MNNKKQNKERQLKILVSENMYMFIKNSAKFYSDGNVSEWVRHCVLNYEPRLLKKAAVKRPKEMKNFN